MTKKQLDKIIAESPEAFASLLIDLQPRILESSAALLEETQDSENPKAVVRVTCSLSIDLCTSPVKWQVEASVGVRHKVRSGENIADDTPELPGLEKGGKHD